MKLNLKDIIDVPGGRIPFEYELDASRLAFPQVARYVEAPVVSGEVRNGAGVLNVEGTVEASMVCVCDRCGAEFPSFKSVPVAVTAVEEEEPEAPDAYPVVGDWLDLDEVFETAFVLDMETKFLCSEDCKGICPECGKNLNEGPCSCGRKGDPRLAVLEQLLDK